MANIEDKVILTMDQIMWEGWVGACSDHQEGYLCELSVAPQIL